MGEAAKTSPDLRARIEACVAHLAHVLPAQASIRDFVHHNTLHGFQHLPFPKAVTAAARTTGASAWLPEEKCRAFFREGRIDLDDLDAAIGQVCAAAEIAPDAPLASLPGRSLTRREVLRLSLLHDLRPLPPSRFRWLVEERDVLGEAPDLWAAVLEVLGIDPAFDHPETLLERSASEAERQDAGAAMQDAFDEGGTTLWDEVRQEVGAGGTATALVCRLTGEDGLEAVRMSLIRQFAAHLDQGLASWPDPARRQGFYAAWRCHVAEDFTWPLEQLDTVRSDLDGLPGCAFETIVEMLTRLGVAEESWPAYLERVALELPGWSGMFLWRQQHPGYAGTADVPVDMLDYLAVRLVLERWATGAIVLRHWGCALSLPALGDHFRRCPAELVVRHAYAEDDLPEYLRELIEPHLETDGEAGLPPDPARWDWLAERIAAWQATPSAERIAGHGVTRSAWPLFRLCRELGLDGKAMRALGRSGAEALLGGLRQLDAEQRGHLWLLAYERHYREQILAGLAANHARWRGHAGRPAAQLVFCMDDREEGMRRHLEEIAPQVETLGGAAHFAVFQNYYGLDEETPTALCPVIPEVIVPSHNVRELPRSRAGVLEQGRRRARRQRWQGWFPGLFGRVAERLWAGREVPIATQLALTASDDSPATPQAPREGFTDAEQAERIGNYLAALGLTRNFAPLVVILGHGSNSLNNPHMAAYDCGACAGRHSGANARLFAAMANRPAVRELLKQRGIDVPADTWFIGAEHNTADDGVTWYDAEDIAVALEPTFARLDADLQAASRAHALERCRRLFSAPLGIGREAALGHVRGRRRDWSQARPELGHATNACAFVGRRAMSRGAFFDRRAFLISYDPTQDPEGWVLERHLLINGAVGAGISLEYFFSTANNAQFGCGSKITHNVTGYLGVMQGASSDLATGLPQQMIEVHEAMRLLVVVEQSLEIITAIYRRQPPLQELVGNGWVVVAAKDPESGVIHLFDPQAGWQRWQGKVDVPTVRESTDWFRGQRGPLPPVLLERPLTT